MAVTVLKPLPKLVQCLHLPLGGYLTRCCTPTSYYGRQQRRWRKISEVRCEREYVWWEKQCVCVCVCMLLEDVSNYAVIIIMVITIRHHVYVVRLLTKQRNCCDVLSGVS